MDCLNKRKNVNTKTAKIIIATHKQYEMPEDEMYLPVHVGAKGKVDEQGNQVSLGYQKDDDGENISEKNASFCELTGLYWAWKNVKADYIGLVHYRRYFGVKQKNWLDGILTHYQLNPMLDQYRVFVPRKRHYYIETLYSHYAHTHYAEQLDYTREIIAEKYPEYLKSYDKVIQCTSGYMFNMMIMSKSDLNDYCSWLFDILFELERRMGTINLSAFQGRFYGRVSEIIFNVWLDEKISSGELDKSEVKELPYFHVENINWMKKGTSFLMAKFLNKKYEGSF